MNRILILLCLFCILVLAACNASPDFDDPPEIRYGEDACERCLMIINEARYAAAYVTTDGDTHRFDDIGGMMAHDHDMAEDVAVFWVHDFDTEEWLKAGGAIFVKSDNLHTPMGFGIVAFSEQDRAEVWAAENEAMVMTFNELVSGNLDMNNDHATEQDQSE